MSKTGTRKPRKLTKASRTYKCGKCHRTIQQGELYHRGSQTITGRATDEDRAAARKTNSFLIETVRRTIFTCEACTEVES